MNKIINYVLGVLIAASICSGALAVVRTYTADVEIKAIKKEIDGKEASLNRIEAKLDRLTEMHMVKR